MELETLSFSEFIDFLKSSDKFDDLNSLYLKDQYKIDINGIEIIPFLFLDSVLLVKKINENKVKIFHCYDLEKIKEQNTLNALIGPDINRLKHIDLFLVDERNKYPFIDYLPSKYIKDIKLVSEVNEKSIGSFDEIKLENKLDWYEDLKFVRNLYSDEGRELARLVYNTFLKNPKKIIEDAFEELNISKFSKDFIYKVQKKGLELHFKKKYDERNFFIKSELLEFYGQKKDIIKGLFSEIDETDFFNIIEGIGIFKEETHKKICPQCYEIFDENYPHRTCSKCDMELSSENYGLNKDLEKIFREEGNFLELMAFDIISPYCTIGKGASIGRGRINALQIFEIDAAVLIKNYLILIECKSAENIDFFKDKIANPILCGLLLNAEFLFIICKSIDDKSKSVCNRISEKTNMKIEIFEGKTYDDWSKAIDEYIDKLLNYELHERIKEIESVSEA